MEMNEYQENLNEAKENSSPLIDKYDRTINEAAISTSGTANCPIRYAGFWMRFWAYLLDLIVVSSLERLLINPLFRMLDISLTEFNIFAPITIASAVIFYLYFVLMTKYFNQTLGKMVFGLKVIDIKNDQLTWGNHSLS